MDFPRAASDVFVDEGSVCIITKPDESHEKTSFNQAANWEWLCTLSSGIIAFHLTSSYSLLGLTHNSHQAIQRVIRLQRAMLLQNLVIVLDECIHSEDYIVTNNWFSCV